MAHQEYFDKTIVIDALLSSAEAVCEYLLSNGKRIRDEWRLGDIYNSPGNSFGINLTTGEYYDFANPSTKGKNLLSLWTLVTGLNWHDALRDAAAFLGIAPGGSKGISSWTRPARPLAQNKTKSKDNRREFVRPTFETCPERLAVHIKQLMKIRELPHELGITYLMELGILGFAMHFGRLAWFICDPVFPAGQARRLDGIDYSKGKALSIPGSNSNIPVGTSNIRDKDYVILCEGGGDLISAVTCAWTERGGNIKNFGFAAILGGHPIAEEYLQHFEGKRIRIAAHHDKPDQDGQITGFDTAEMWNNQLSIPACNIDYWCGEPGEDLTNAATRNTHTVNLTENMN